MNDQTRPNSGKITLHGRGTGPAARADVERRARELALTEGRYAVTADDLAQAENDLGGAGATAHQPRHG